MIEEVQTGRSKVCNRCKQDKLWDEFYMTSRGRPATRCKQCVSEVNLEKALFRESNIVVLDEKVCGDCKVLKSAAEFALSYRTTDGLRWDCADCRKNRNLIKTYGITLEDYKVMYEAQQGLCKICKQPESIERISLAVDHCHTTGAVRGLLCGRCNKAIGLFDDDLTLMESATAYLRGEV